MFRRTRWWLVAWNVLVFGLILLLVSVTASFLLSRNLLATVDNNLAAQSTSTGHELLEMRDHP
ncbi:MAG: hypothetical protein M1118_03870, partial [Chloroflexi bacterium]|nr:hypothetical protein [Chloroflexota bacterium]